jgi:hypothetical protein
MTRPPSRSERQPCAPSPDASTPDDDAALSALFEAFRDGRSPAAQIAGRLRRVLGDEAEPARARPGDARPS